MSKKIVISNDLSLPIDAATETFGILGRRGSGKSHTGSVMAEEMLKLRVPIVAYDPTGAWYGLKSSVDGKSPGYPVVIFGGEHADVPLAEVDGEMIARAIVAERFPAILDCSLLRKGSRLRLMADFLETLYHENREAIHFFGDELHTIAPLNLRNVGEASVYQSRCVGAIEDIILQGRRRGIGMTGMSQRPALVNASVRSQFGTLIAMQMNAPLDRQAIAEWIEEKGTEEEGEKLLAQLPRLERGTGIVWSTVFDILKTVKFRARETFDSGRTPGVGEKRIEPKAWAEIDIDKLGATIAAKREEKKANDPKELQRQLADLRKQLAAAGTAKTVEKVKEVQILGEAHVKRLEAIAGKLEGEGRKLVETGEKMLAEAAAVRHTVTTATARMAGAAAPVNRPVPRAVMVKPSRPVLAKPAGDAVGRDALAGPARKIIDAIAWLESIGISEPEQTAVAFLAGYTYGGGAFNNPRGALRTKDLVDYLPGNRIKLTDAGRALASVPDEPLTQEGIHAKVMEVLPGPEQRILAPLLSAYPNGMTNDELAAAAGYSGGGGAYNNPRGRLRTLGLVEYRNGQVVARDILFPEALAK